MTVQRTSFRPRCIHSIQQQGMWRHNLGYTSVDIVLSDYSLPFRSSVHHSSEQERSDILVLWRMTRKVNVYYHFVHKFHYSKYTSPFGTPSSIQETPFNQGIQNFLPEKGTRKVCSCYPCWRDISIQGKGSLFLGASFRGHLGSQNVTDHKEHKSQWWQLSQHELSYLNQCTELVGIQLTISLRKAYLVSLQII